MYRHLGVVILSGFFAFSCSKKPTVPVAPSSGRLLAAGNARDLRVSSDGKWVAYLLEARKPTTLGVPSEMLLGSLHVVSTEGVSPKQLGPSVTNVAGGYGFSPDSRWLFFLSGYNPATHAGELFVQDLTQPEAPAKRLGGLVSFAVFGSDSGSLAWIDGGVLKVSALGDDEVSSVAGDVSTAEFSPDGKWLLIKRKGQAGGGLWVTSARGGTPLKMADQVGDYKISADSLKVAFQKRSTTEPHIYDLYVAVPPRFVPQMVARAASQFHFSNDSKWLVRTQGNQAQGGTDALNLVGELMVGPAEGGRGRKIGEQVADFVLSPDSSQIAFLDRYNLQLRQGRLAIASIAGGDPKPLASKVTNLLWSPDSKRLAFQSIVFSEFGPSPDLYLFELGSEKPTLMLPWVFGYGFGPAADHLVARGNCSRVGTNKVPRACDLMKWNLPLDPKKVPPEASKWAEGVYSFKHSEDGTKLMISAAQLGSELFDVSVYDVSSKALLVQERNLHLPAHFLGKSGDAIVYTVGDLKRAGVYKTDVKKSVSASIDLAPWGSGQSRGEDLSILLVTFGPGLSVPSWFGHSALVVEDSQLKQGRLYNYGMFSFDETMLMRFAKGRLTFWVGEAGIVSTLLAYRDEGRDVRIQELNFEPNERLEIAKALALNVLPENRGYLYHHYNDNCSTRPRDLIDRVIGGALKSADKKEARMTLREHTRRHAHVNPGMSLLLDFLMNDEIDRPITQWEEAFLPEELENQLASLKYVNSQNQEAPVVKRAWTYAKGVLPQVPKTAPQYEQALWALGGTLGLSAAFLAWKSQRSPVSRVFLGGYNALLGLALGLPGTALAIMWAFTEHTVTYRNENLFFANPLTLLAFPLGLMTAWGSRRGLRGLQALWFLIAGLSLVGVLLKVLPAFNQDNVRLIALLLPLNCCMAVGLKWVSLNNPKVA